jgi:hypothetical protein
MTNLLAILTAAAVRSGVFAATGDSSPEIQRLEQELARAIVAIDVEAIRRIEAPTYVYTGSDGQVGLREDFIDGYQAGNTVRSISFGDVIVEIYGDAAVVRGVQRVERVAEGVTIRRLSRYTRFYVRFPQGWQAVAGHSSAIPPPPDSRAP